MRIWCDLRVDCELFCQHSSPTWVRHAFYKKKKTFHDTKKGSYPIGKSEHDRDKKVNYVVSTRQISFQEKNQICLESNKRLFVSLINWHLWGLRPWKMSGMPLCFRHCKALSIPHRYLSFNMVAGNNLICKDNSGIHSTRHWNPRKAPWNWCIRWCQSISNGCQDSRCPNNAPQICFTLFCKCKFCQRKVTHHWPLPPQY